MPAYIEHPRPGTPASRRDRRLVFLLLQDAAEFRDLARDYPSPDGRYPLAARRALQKVRTARLIAGDRLP